LSIKTLSMKILIENLFAVHFKITNSYNNWLKQLYLGVDILLYKPKIDKCILARDFPTCGFARKCFDKAEWSYF